MHINGASRSLWTEITGTPEELREVQDRLSAWSRQLSPGRHAVRVWIPVDVDRIRVLTGALLCTRMITLHHVHRASQSTDRLIMLAQTGLARTYQVGAAAELLFAKGGRGVAALATGAGKTLIAAILSAVMPGEHWLYLVTSASLAEQAESMTSAVLPDLARMLSIEQGQLRCRSYGTASREDLAWATGVLVDECVPAGTLVGGKPIENIRVGDLVPSWNFKLGQLVQRRVRGISRRRASMQQLIKMTAGKESLCATPGHPLPRAHDWSAISSIKCGEAVLCCVSKQGVEHAAEKNNRQNLRSLRFGGGRQETSQSSRRGAVLQQMQADTEAGACKGDSTALQGVQKRSAVDWPAWIGACKRKFGLLLRAMQEVLDASSVVRSTWNLFAAACGGDSRENATAESDVPRDYTKSSSTQSSLARLAQGSVARRKRKENTNSPGNASKCFRMESGSSDIHQIRPRSEGAAHSLQSRYWAACIESWHRGGWPLAQLPDSPQQRCKENSRAEWIRVDHTAVHEQTSDGTFGGLCPDGFVYNLEIEADSYDEMNYEANGFIVHNCHGLPAKNRARVLEYIRADWWLGMSATPTGRVAGDNSLVLGLLGPVVYTRRLDELDGYLAKGRVVVVQYDQRLGKIVKHIK